jgi:hypothetical protein
VIDLLVRFVALASSSMLPPYPYSEAVQAMRDWIREHGQLPHERDWERSEKGRPCARTVRRRWGWYELMADALDIDLAEILELEGQIEERGILPRRPRRLRRDLLGAMIAFHDRWDRWPSGSDWERATLEHPARGTYVRRFGSWPLAVEAADRERRRLKRGRQHPAAGSTPALMAVNQLPGWFERADLGGE